MFGLSLKMPPAYEIRSNINLVFGENTTKSTRIVYIGLSRAHFLGIVVPFCSNSQHLKERLNGVLVFPHMRAQAVGRLVEQGRLLPREQLRQRRLRRLHLLRGLPLPAAAGRPAALPGGGTIYQFAGPDEYGRPGNGRPGAAAATTSPWATPARSAPPATATGAARTPPATARCAAASTTGARPRWRCGGWNELPAFM